MFADKSEVNFPENEPKTPASLLLIFCIPCRPHHGIEHPQLQILTLTVVYNGALITLITFLTSRLYQRPTLRRCGRATISMNKDGIYRRDVPVCACARVRVSGGDCRFRNNVAEGKGRVNAAGKVRRGLREDVAREMLVERKKGGGGREVCMCVVVSLYTCIGARVAFVRASEGTRTCVSVFTLLGEYVREGQGMMCYLGKKKI